MKNCISIKNVSYLLCFITCIFIIAGCNSRETQVESIRAKLDSLSTVANDEEFIKELTTGFNRANVYILHNSHLSSTNRVLNVDIEGDVRVMEKELGQIAKWDTVESVGLLLWLASSRISSIEKINVNWKQFAGRDTVYFKATVIPNKIRINWNDPQYFMNYLETHEEDSRNRFDKFLNKKIWAQSAIRVNYNTASGKVLKWQ